MLEFTWRSFGVDAGDTRVRWYAPVLVGPGSLPQDAREWGAARKCAAYAERLLYDVAASQRFYPYGLEQVKHGVAVLREALAEFLADDDPVETRAEREVSTGAR